MRFSDTLHIPARKHVCNTVRAARRCVGCAKQIFDTIKHSQNTHNFLFSQFLDPLHIPTRKHICERVRAARRCVGCAKHTFDTRQYSQITATHCNTLQHTAFLTPCTYLHKSTFAKEFARLGLLGRWKNQKITVVAQE